MCNILRITTYNYYHLRPSGVSRLYRIHIMTSFLTLTILGLDGYSRISTSFFRRHDAGR